MAAPLRKLGLTLHVVVSIGWLGAIVAFLAMAVASLSKDAALARAAYLAMGVIARAVLLPLSAATLLSGVAQSLGSKWGLFRYNWVVAKLALTILAVVGLVIHQQTAIVEAGRLAAVASSALASPRLHQLSIQLVNDASFAIVVLVAITAISIYKPWGLVNRATSGLRLFYAAIAAVLAAFIALHLSGRSPHQHHH